MYIFRNAINNVRRSKGRSAMFGAIVFIIALSACLALSIRQAAQTSEEEGLEKLSISANISLDMEQIMGQKSGSDSDSASAMPSKDEMTSAMQNSSLTLDELKKYAELSAVKSFYYTGTLSVDSSTITAISTDSGSAGGGGGPGGNGRMSQGSGDFTITGYSSDDAMTDFVDGNSTISEGAMFDEGTSDATCVISSTLATYNSLSVGDTITFTDPDDESKTFDVTISGIYESSTSTDQSSGGRPGQMTSNNIYMSYNALESIATASDMTLGTQGTYTFSSYENYSKFEDQAHDAGLDEKYTVESRDIQNFEQQLQPLQNLSKYATIFLVIIMIIGGAVLVILSMFNIRDRKYEIGVLAAIGMAKKKIAKQFIYEISLISILAILIGGTIGSLASVPVTNKLLTTVSTTTTQDNFGRGGGPGGAGGPAGEAPDQSTQDSNSESSSDDSSNAEQSSKGPKMFGAPASMYVSSVTSATNYKVILELTAIGMILVLISGGVAVGTITRYDPLAILTNRD